MQCPKFSVKLRGHRMLIGLDFDNTIVRYDNAIKVLSEDIPNLPPDLPRTKLSLRNFLRDENREDEWTLFQGKLYGPGMRFADPFPQAITSMKALICLGHELVIVSHRSKRPYAGEPYDLHFFAQQWITDNLRPQGLFNLDTDQPNVFFLESKSEKISKITSLNCQVFIDDLPEIFSDLNFPARTKRFLFNPNNQPIANSDHPFLLLDHWNDLPQYISSP